MTQPPPSSLTSKIDRAIKAAVADAIESHRQLGQSISIWHDGRVVTLTADQIPPLQAEADKGNSDRP